MYQLRSRTARYLGSAACLYSLALVSGCGSGASTYPVTGKVEFSSGEPVPSCRVVFDSAEHGLRAEGMTDERGEFSLGTYGVTDGVPAGNYRAIVRHSPPAVQAEDGKPLPPKIIPLVDPKFSDYGTSGLEFVVKSGEENEFDIVVDRNPRAK